MNDLGLQQVPKRGRRDDRERESFPDGSRPEASSAAGVSPRDTLAPGLPQLRELPAEGFPPPPKLSAETFFKAYFELESPAAAPTNSKEKEELVARLVDWFAEQPGLRLQRTNLLGDLGGRLVEMGLHTIAEVMAYPREKLMENLQAFDHSIFPNVTRLGSTAPLLLRKALNVGDALLKKIDEREAGLFDEQPPPAPKQSSNSASAADQLLPILTSIMKNADINTKTQTQIGKCLDMLGNKAGGGKKKPADHKDGESDNEGDNTRVDLGGILDGDRCFEEGVRSFIPVDYFTGGTRLGRAKRKSTRSNYEVPYVFNSGVEEWEPRWPTFGLTQSAVDKLQKDRPSRVFREPAAFLANLSTELLALYAIGEIPLVSILGKLLLTIRQIDGHGLAYATTYYGAEKAYVDALAGIGDKLEYGTFMCKEHEEITKSLKHSFPNGPFHDVLYPDNSRSSSGKHETVKRERSRSPRRQSPKASGSPPKGQLPTNNGREHICFAHDAREGKVCPGKGGKCPRLHLNTELKENSEKYDKAHASFIRSRKKKGNNR